MGFDASGMMAELLQLGRVQKQMAAQLDVMDGLLRRGPAARAGQESGRLGGKRGFWAELVGSMRTGDSGLAAAAAMTAVVVGAAAAGALALARSQRR